MSAEQRQSVCPDTALTIGGWRADPRANELHRGAQTVKLEPKVMQVLCVLAARAGSVVTRDELESRVWPGLVVTSDAVTNTIIKLRKALGDDFRQPRYIQTISKRGYRLVADVTRDTGQATSPAALPRRRLLAGALVVLSGIAAAALWLGVTERGPPPASRPDVPDLRQGPGIAVLPFDNLGATPEQDYFARGITEDLITDLSKLADLLVVARNSTFAYEGSLKDDQVIARELGVDYILKGSVRRSGDSMRINVRLTDSESGRHLWADRYDRRIDDIFQLQDEIAAQVVAALKLEMAAGELSPRTGSHLASVRAYDEFLQGLDHYGRRSREDNQLAKQHYERAIAIDPKFARAYASLALVFTREAVDGWDLTPRDALTQAADLVEKAHGLDPSLPEIYFVRGVIELYRHQFDAAVHNAEQAIAIKPSYADAHALLAWILHFSGRPAEGLASMRRAVRLNPRLPSVYRLLRGQLHYAREDLDKALADFETGVEINPSYEYLRVWLAAAYAAAGRMDEAQWESREVLALDPEFSIARMERALPIRDPVYRERFLRDLRRAGLPD